MAVSQMRTFKCRLKAQGYSAGSCLVEAQGQRRLACQATLRYANDPIARLIISIHLSIRAEKNNQTFHQLCHKSEVQFLHRIRREVIVRIAKEG